MTARTARCGLPGSPVPAAGFSLTKGRTPRTGEQKLRVQFRNGYVDAKHDYRAKDLRWDETGHAWDVVAVRKA